MLYIGTDIVPLFKIKIMIEENQSFLNKIFSNSEQAYCNSKKEPFIHYGGRFAAKESIKKALLSSDKIKRISLKSINVTNNDIGVPCVELINCKLLYKELKVTISHAGEYAIAMAVIRF